MIKPLTSVQLQCLEHRWPSGIKGPSTFLHDQWGYEFEFCTLQVRSTPILFDWDCQFFQPKVAVLVFLTDVSHLHLNHIFTYFIRILYLLDSISLIRTSWKSVNSICIWQQCQGFSSKYIRRWSSQNIYDYLSVLVSLKRCESWI